ncbi:hypothetical protein [Microvirga subterranea]|uniref:Uncharacterized protein n=1 Tax=Microvirga subterranea TaxID=186651 RepID=A0A370HHB6_9HYPH|nr:hypothetical protein [Microvirga subterranea]RDI57109.1 hypothetical protein DES45_10724 [Microvirga subterranea]
MAGLGFLRNAFGRPKADRAAIERVKDLARKALRAGPDASFAVNEIVCADPACPGTETVILVMEPGAKTKAYKVPKPLDEIVEQDIGAALDP